MEKTQYCGLSWKDFQFLKKLGKGSFSDVHLIKRLQDDKLLAMKTVQMDRLTPSQRQSALNQIRLLASIEIQNIVSYEGSFFSSLTNSLCLLMEFCEGGDLQNIIKKESLLNKSKKPTGLDQQFAWKTLVDVLRGLRILHAHKIAHRDLKSANIFYSKGIAKIGDLNVSSAADSSFYKTKTGTPYYTAPQIWKGEEYECNCDIWSLGCIIYEICALKPPFQASNFPDLFVRIARGEYLPLSETYSDDLRTIIRLCLETDPKQRISAEELLKSKIIINKIRQLKIQENFEGEINLIDKIKCPKFLKNLNEYLPIKQIDNNMKSKKKIRTVEFTQTRKQYNSVSKLANTKLRSEKFIEFSPDKHKKIGQKVIRSMKKIPPKCLDSQVNLPSINKRQKSAKKIDFR